MSGFITTMFVSSATSFYPSFPSKPKPLQPIFTFAQSQSCMNLGMEVASHNVLMVKEKSREGVTDCWSGFCAPAKPQLTYKSPLQRIGEALRTPQPASTTSIALDSGVLRGTEGNKLDSLPSAAQNNPQSNSSHKSQAGIVSNYPYRLLPGGNCSSDRLHTRTSSKPRSGEVVIMANGNGNGNGNGNSTISSPASRAEMASRNRGYLPGTSLLSSLFSNPRTRAPFKPQKSNRGTSSWQLKQYAEATLGSGSLRKAVRLPEGEDKDEWLAVNGETFAYPRRNQANVSISRRLLQPNQPTLWLNYGVLLTTNLSRDESHRRVQPP